MKGKPTIKKNIKINKIFRIYTFFLVILASFVTQLIHCIMFYYCRNLFVHIIEGNTKNLLVDIQKYIFMFLVLCIYGFIMNRLHPVILKIFINKKKIALLIEDILLGWKYFLILFVLLCKMFFIAHWALAPYILITSLLILYDKKLFTIGVFAVLMILHYLFYCSKYTYLSSLLMVSYSSIYLAIAPCLHTIRRLQALLKIK